jgi:hypothetical protein
MGKVIFSIQYEIDPVKRNEFLAVAKELKSLVVAEGLESYSVYEAKPNHFEEIYIFVSKEAHENFDDSANERINLLINKLTDIKVKNTTKYTVYNEVV